MKSLRWMVVAALILVLGVTSTLLSRPRQDVGPLDNVNDQISDTDSINRIREAESFLENGSFADIRVGTNGSIEVDVALAAAGTAYPSNLDEVARGIADRLARDYVPGRLITVNLVRGGRRVGQGTVGHLR